MNSLKHEIAFLFSGMGMPYEVAMLVAVVCAVLFTVLLGNNFIEEAPVAVIDLDNSKYSHRLIRNGCVALYRHQHGLSQCCQPQGLILPRPFCCRRLFSQGPGKEPLYSDAAGQIGVFYDNTSIAQNADIMEALNTIVAEENNKLSAPETSRAERAVSMCRSEA